MPEYTPQNAPQVGDVAQLLRVPEYFRPLPADFRVGRRCVVRSVEQPSRKYSFPMCEVKAGLILDDGTITDYSYFFLMKYLGPAETE